MTTNKLLRDVLPHEFDLDYPDDKAQKFLDVKVIKEHGLGIDNLAWPGKHKFVFWWCELENGKSVAWNENPGRGWSFPVMKSKQQPMSREASCLIAHMMAEISTMSYGYRTIICGCYDAAVQNYGFTEPVEGMDFCVDTVIDLLNKSQVELCTRY